MRFSYERYAVLHSLKAECMMYDFETESMLSYIAECIDSQSTRDRLKRFKICKHECLPVSSYSTFYTYYKTRELPNNIFREKKEKFVSCMHEKCRPIPWKLQKDVDQKSNVMGILVRASGLNVTGLLALVAHALTLGFRGAVTRDVANFAAVVALLTLSAVTGHVAETTARVTGLLATTSTTGTTETTVVATSIVTTLRAVACNVTDLSALVAFLGTTTAVVAVAALGAFARKMSSLAATVA
jgi:hypothetical protein